MFAIVGIAVLGIAVPAGAVDPNSRNLPPQRKVVFFLGQDSETLSEFRQAILDIDPSFPHPGGVVLYTGIRRDSGPGGVFEPIDYGAGLVDFDATLAEFDGALQVGLDLVDCTLEPLLAIAGDASIDEETRRAYRARLDALISYLRNTGRRVYLRIGYEFDGPWNCYQPEAYRAAFRAVKTRIDQLGASNVATVWQSAANPLAASEGMYDPSEPGHWDRWYPGDDVVDWVGLSLFLNEHYRITQVMCADSAWLDATATPRQIQDDLLDFARAHDKPVLIAEAAPQGFDLWNRTAACIMEQGQPWAQQLPVTPTTIWTLWFEDYFDFIASNRDVVRGATYINTWWDSQSMWRCDASGCGNGYWGDSRIQACSCLWGQFKVEIRADHFLRGPFGSSPTIAGPRLKRGVRAPRHGSPEPGDGGTSQERKAPQRN